MIALGPVVIPSGETRELRAHVAHHPRPTRMIVRASAASMRKLAISKLEYQPRPDRSGRASDAEWNGVVVIRFSNIGADGFSRAVGARLLP